MMATDQKGELARILSKMRELLREISQLPAVAGRFGAGPADEAEVDLMLLGRALNAYLEMALDWAMARDIHAIAATRVADGTISASVGKLESQSTELDRKRKAKILKKVADNIIKALGAFRGAPRDRPIAAARGRGVSRYRDVQQLPAFDAVTAWLAAQRDADNSDDAGTARGIHSILSQGDAIEAYGQPPNLESIQKAVASSRKAARKKSERKHWVTALTPSGAAKMVFAKLNLRVGYPEKARETLTDLEMSPEEVLALTGATRLEPRDQLVDLLLRTRQALHMLGYPSQAVRAAMKAIEESIGTRASKKGTA